MPNPIKTVCWDSCTFVSLIEETPDRIDDLRAVFEEAIRKEIRLVASTICITEVAFAAAERAEGLSTPIEKKIEKLWSPGSPVELVDYTWLVARQARKLLRMKIQTGLPLKPLDAIHIATAIQEQARELHTYDRRLEAWSKDSGIDIRPPKPFQMLLDGH